MLKEIIGIVKNLNILKFEWFVEFIFIKFTFETFEYILRKCFLKPMFNIKVYIYVVRDYLKTEV